MATSTDKNPVHVYSTPGTYTVSLTVQDASGSDGYARTNYIYVANPPVTLTLGTVDPTGSVDSVSGLGTYAYGTPVTLTASFNAVPDSGYADIVFLVDESGSMNAEQEWLETMPAILESKLLTLGIGNDPLNPNQYALVGFGGKAGGIHGSTVNAPHKHLVGGTSFGTASQLQTAAAALEADGGGNEDGYWAMQFALANYTFRTDASKVFILISDEDRTGQSGVTDKLRQYRKDATEDLMSDSDVILASILNLVITDTTPSASVIGRRGTKTYAQSGASFVETVFSSIAAGALDGGTSNQYVVNGSPALIYGNTPPLYDTAPFHAENEDYVILTEDLGGSEWNLNILRDTDSPDNATAFTDAFTSGVSDQILNSFHYEFDHWIIDSGSYYGSNPFTFTPSASSTVNVFAIRVTT